MRRIHMAAMAAMAGGLLVTGPGSIRGAGEGMMLDGIAAYVNSHTITVGDALAMMEPVRRQLVARFRGHELRDRLGEAYAEAVDRLVGRYLVVDAYETGEGRIPDWAVDKRVEDFIQEEFAGDRNAMIATLAKENMTFDEWRRRLEEQIIVAAMRSSSVEALVSVAPEDVRAYYDAHLDEYQKPSKVNLRMIVLPSRGSEDEAPGVAVRAAIDRLDAGEDFALLARELSTGNKAAEGGDWGWLEPGVLRPELADAAATLKPGERSEPIEIGGDVYILKVEGIMESTVEPFDDVEGEIEAKLKREQSEERYQAWIDRLKADAYVRVFDVDLF